jgi:hypothetical protein
VSNDGSDDFDTGEDGGDPGGLIGGISIHWPTKLRLPVSPQGGALVQSQDLPSPLARARKLHGNLHFITPLSQGGLGVYTRDDVDSRLLWHGPHVLSTASGYTGATIIQSDYDDGTGNTSNDLEALAVRDGVLEFYFQIGGVWRGPTSLVTVDSRGAETPLVLPRLTGNPSMIQGSYGGSSHPNFEAIIARADGGIVHIFRDNEHQMLWRVGADRIGGATMFTGVALIEGDLRQHDAEHANFEAVATTSDGALVRFFRDNLKLQWSSAIAVTLSGVALTGVSGTPGMIITSYVDGGSDRKLRIGVVPSTDGGLVMFSRGGAALDLFGGPIDLVNPASAQSRYFAATLIESDYRTVDEGNSGNLEILATRLDGGFDHFFRDNAVHASGAIHGPFAVRSVDDRTSVRSLLARRGISQSIGLRTLGASSIRQLLSQA